MLSVNRLNEERKQVNQRLTKDGLRKQNVPQIIEAVALTLDPKAYTDESSTIDKQLAVMDREIKEKKLMAYQLKNNPQNVSNFLANKYSDGNFNIGVVDRYDNSEERKKHGITFDYHVYLKPESEMKVPKEKRGHNKYILSDPVHDRSTGDTYTYHIPVWIDTSGEAPFYTTDYGENVNDPHSKGLLWALGQLRVAIDSGKYQVNPEAEEILTQWGFLDDGKIVHDIKRGVVVEKYLKSFKNEDKKIDAVKYLDTMVKADNQASHDDIEYGYELDELDKTHDPKKPPGDDNINESDDDIGSKSDESVETSEDAQSLKITPGEYLGKTVYQIANENRLPIVQYRQMKPTNKPFSAEINVPIDGVMYNIRLRTGSVGALRMDRVFSSIAQYETQLKQNVASGKITPAKLPKVVKDLLESKGFSSLTKGEVPNISINGFTAATTK